MKDECKREPGGEYKREPGGECNCNGEPGGECNRNGEPGGECKREPGGEHVHGARGSV